MTRESLVDKDALTTAMIYSSKKSWCSLVQLLLQVQLHAQNIEPTVITTKPGLSTDVCSDATQWLAEKVMQNLLQLWRHVIWLGTSAGYLQLQV